MSLRECPDCKNQVSDQAPACPKCGRPISPNQPSTEKPKKKGIGCGGAILIVLGLIVGLAILGSLGNKGTTTSSTASSQAARLSESSPEYQEMVLKHMGIVTNDPDIDKIRVDGSLLYINFIRPQAKQEYVAVAQMNAIKFSEFKNSKLGVSSVSVITTLNGKEVAQANARGGKITKTQ